MGLAVKTEIMPKCSENTDEQGTDYFDEERTYPSGCFRWHGYPIHYKVLLAHPVLCVTVQTIWTCQLNAGCRRGTFLAYGCTRAGGTRRSGYGQTACVLASRLPAASNYLFRQKSRPIVSWSVIELSNAATYEARVQRQNDLDSSKPH